VQFTNKIILIIFILCFYYVITGAGGFFLFKYVSEPERTNELLPSADDMRDNLSDEAVNLKQVVEKTTRDIDPSELEKDKIYIAHQQSLDACINNETYGYDKEKNIIWTKNGCKGIFYLNGKQGNCDSKQIPKDSPPGTETYAECPIGEFRVNDNKRIIGLGDRKLYLIGTTDDKPENCNGNYGYVGTNDIYSEGNCAGIFYMNGLNGKCISENGNRAICPIGRTDQDEHGNINGLMPWPMSIRAEFSPKGTCFNSYTNKINYGVANDGSPKVWVKDNCKANITMFNVDGNCYSYGDKTECDIGRISQDENGDNVGLIY